MSSNNRLAEVERLAAFIAEWSRAQSEYDVGTVLASLYALGDADLRLFAQAILDNESDWRG